MTDEPEKNRKLNRLGWGCAVIVLLLLLYMLSPPFVVMIIGWDKLKEIIWIYEPIGILRELPAFDDAFNWYLSLFPEEIWN